VAELETVLPAPGGAVRVLSGPHAGCAAELVAIHEERFCAEVRLTSGRAAGTVLPALEYEAICKVDPQLQPAPRW
jgi:DNA/RNA-binding protein KIN17